MKRKCLIGSTDGCEVGGMDEVVSDAGVKIVAISRRCPELALSSVFLNKTRPAEVLRSGRVGCRGSQRCVRSLRPWARL
mgnify:CR=1 FL=1